MPMSSWEDVAGKTCEICGNPATHYYGWTLICCDCHVGEKDGGLFTKEQAQEEHTRILIRRAEEGGE
jgi:hypothetical protein